MISPDDDWPLPHPPPDLCDEAAANIADFLMQLALCFESTYLAQIRRYHQAMQPTPADDSRQLDLFDPF